MDKEVERLVNMSNAELDAELRSYGVDPDELNRKMLKRLLKARDQDGYDTPLLHEMIRQFSEKAEHSRGSEPK
jgi:hypothetical protein